VDIPATVTPELERELLRMQPWMQPFRLAENVIVGRFKKSVDSTVCISTSPPELIAKMQEAYAGYMAGDSLWSIRTLLARVEGAADKSFLDIASATGRFSFGLAAGGAGSVLGVEIRPEQVAQAELIRSLDDRFAAVRFEHEPTSADDPGFRAGEQFDVVLSMGLLYHLTNPIEHLRNLRKLAREAVLMHTLTHTQQREYWMLTLEDPAGITKAWEGISWIPHWNDVPELMRQAGFRSVEVIASPAVAELHAFDTSRHRVSDLVLPGAATKLLNRRRAEKYMERLNAAGRRGLSPRYYTYLAFC
jgi:SAM-dependent methyltransferase